MGLLSETCGAVEDEEMSLICTSSHAWPLRDKADKKAFYSYIAHRMTHRSHATATETPAHKAFITAL